MHAQIDGLMAAFKLTRYGELADLAGVTPAAICRWRERGVSARARLRLMREAERRNIKLPASVWGDEPQHEAA